MNKCYICNQEFKALFTLTTHLNKVHNLTTEQYYLKFYGTQGFCAECNLPTKFITLEKGYRIFCSRKCAASNSKTREICKQTCIKRYGTNNPQQNEKIKQKTGETCVEKYGTKCALQNEKIKQKTKETCIKRYGVANANQSEKIKIKKKNTCLKNYGVNCSLQGEQAKQKSKQTCIKKYNKAFAQQNSQIKQKVKKIFDEKYGGHPSQFKNFKQKYKETSLNKYETEHPWQNSEIKQKVQNSLLNRYNADHPLQNTQIKDKFNQTCLKRYGSANPAQSSFLKEILLKKRIVEVEKCLYTLNLKYIDGYKHAQKPLEVKCLICNTLFITTFFNLQQGCGRCPNCFPKYKSIAETEILNFIKSFGLDVIENSRQIINPLELDIFIPIKNIAIEYNGVYWHSELKNNDKNYHLNKLNMCQEKDIQLIQIFEDEWIMHQDVVKSRLKQILGVNDSQRIHARCCIIKPIISKIKNEFLMNYHLQKTDNAPLSLGAFYNDQLVAVMTFSHGSLAKGIKKKDDLIWELNRYCCDNAYHIPGIASKLLSYFKKNYKWKTIYSFADRRWSNGNLYKVLGFELESITKPNYWYVKKGDINRLHRFALRKRENEPQDVPEHILRMQEGYTRVWDCGNLKFMIEKRRKIHE